MPLLAWNVIDPIKSLHEGVRIYKYMRGKPLLFLLLLLVVVVFFVGNRNLVVLTLGHVTSSLTA